jgi:hypothetical protein
MVLFGGLWSSGRIEEGEGEGEFFSLFFPWGMG